MSIRPLFDSRLATPLAAIALLVCITVTGAETGQSKPIQGVLLDKTCSLNAETRMVPSPSPHMEGGMLWAYTHTRQCLLMPACEHSGYGIFTYDDRYLTFDAAGNQKALAAIQASKKQDDIRIEITGQIDGEKIKVTSLKLVP